MEGGDRAKLGNNPVMRGKLSAKMQDSVDGKTTSSGKVVRSAKSLAEWRAGSRDAHESDAHEWSNEIPTVPNYYLAKPQPRERAWQK